MQPREVVEGCDIEKHVGSPRVSEQKHTVESRFYITGQIKVSSTEPGFK